MEAHISPISSREGLRTCSIVIRVNLFSFSPISPSSFAMPSPKPTLLIVSGGWHVPESYSRLTKELEEAGYEVHVPRLPSMNEARPPTADLADDTALIRSYAQDLIRSGRQVAVIMHSYGGQVGTNALYGLGVGSRGEHTSGGVSHLIYMAAFAQPEGWSMIDKVEEFNHSDLIPVAFDFADDKTVVSQDARRLLVSDTALSEGEVDAYVETLVRWNGKCMYDRVERAAWREIPVSYVMTKGDMTVPLEYQRSMVEGMRRAGREVGTFEVATGHCPGFTATGEVVEMIEKILGNAE